MIWGSDNALKKKTKYLQRCKNTLHHCFEYFCCKMWQHWFKILIMFQLIKGNPWMRHISHHHCYLYITLREALCAGSDSFMSGIKEKENKMSVWQKKQLNHGTNKTLTKCWKKKSASVADSCMNVTYLTYRWSNGSKSQDSSLQCEARNFLDASSYKIQRGNLSARTKTILISVLLLLVSFPHLHLSQILKRSCTFALIALLVTLMTLTWDKCNYKSRCWIIRSYPRNDNSCELTTRLLLSSGCHATCEK